jgi:sugar O-acyltransferase (sialic acid O-acetyltransferase NeuD family)
VDRALIGGGDHTREVIAQMGQSLPVFVPDEFFVPGKRDFFKMSDLDPNKFEVLVSIGDSRLRQKVVKSLPKSINFFTYIHPTALILDQTVEIGTGSFIGAYSILTLGISLGKHALLNRFCQIGHDCTIGDFFSMMPSSVVSGRVTIGRSVYLGANSSIKEKLKIDDDITVGMNSGVVSPLLKMGVYVGTPAKWIK